MKKPIAVAAAVLALGVAGTAVAAPGGGVFGGGDKEERQAEFASDLAQKLDGVNAERGRTRPRTAEIRARGRNAERAGQALASGLDGVSVQQAKAALEAVSQSVGEDQRPDPSEMEALLAEELGVSVDDLAEARKAEMTQRLDQAVEDGAITEEQADEMRAKIESGELPPPGGPGHGGPVGPAGPGHGGPGGPGRHFGSAGGPPESPATPSA